MAEKKISFSWDAHDTAESFQLYEDGIMIISNIVFPYFDLLMTGKEQGVYTYTVRAVNKYGVSDDSNMVTVNFFLPNPVTNLHFIIV